MPSIPITGNPNRLTIVLKGRFKTVSETHWDTNSTNTIEQTLQKAASLVYARLQLTGEDTEFQLARVSKDNKFRDSRIMTTSQGGHKVSFGPSDPGATALLLRMEADADYRKSMFLSLLPDKFIDQSEFVGNNDAQFKAAFDLWKNIMTNTGSAANGGWGFLSVDKDPVNFPKVKITNIAFGIQGANDTLVVTATLPGLVKPDVVRLAGIKSTITINGAAVPSNFYNGLYVVDSIAAGEFTIVLGPNANTGRKIQQFGTAQKMTRVIKPYNAILERPVTSRKRGARTGLPLGKLKKAKVGP